MNHSPAALHGGIDSNAGGTQRAFSPDSKANLGEYTTPSSSARSPTENEDPARLTRHDEELPPLPPRPSDLGEPCQAAQSPPNILRLPKRSRPQLQSAATTAVSLTDIHTQSYQDGSRETFSTPARSAQSGQFLTTIRRLKGTNGSEAETASARSSTPTLEAGGYAESLIGDIIGAPSEEPTWRLTGNEGESLDLLSPIFLESSDDLSSFDQEFEELKGGADDEGTAIACHVPIWANESPRTTPEPMETQEKALSHTLICRKAYLQSSWRRQPHFELYWRDTNHNFFLRRRTKSAKWLYRS